MAGSAKGANSCEQLEGTPMLHDGTARQVLVRCSGRLTQSNPDIGESLLSALDQIGPPFGGAVHVCLSQAANTSRGLHRLQDCCEKRFDEALTFRNHFIPPVSA